MVYFIFSAKLIKKKIVIKDFTYFLLSLRPNLE